MQCLESEDSYLEAYMEWRHLETVYWQWMVMILLIDWNTLKCDLSMCLVLSLIHRTQQSAIKTNVNKINNNKAEETA